jgi:archaeosine synthase alpha-subunit
VLEVLARTFQGRRVRWTGENFRIETPSILFLSGKNEAPSFAEALIEPGKGMGSATIVAKNGARMEEIGDGVFIPLSLEVQVISGEWQIEKPPNSKESGEIAILEHAFEMRRDARAFVHHLKGLRESVGPAKLIYAPGMMDLSNMALLAYMGIDLFDSALLSYQASRGVLSLPEGSISAKDAEWLIEEPTSNNVEEFVIKMAGHELGLVRHMIRVGRLRELAEIRANSTPWGIAAMRLFDLEGYSLQESQASVTGPRFYANSMQSLNRPDVARWRKRVLDRWSPSHHKKILLLLPCSAKKPYFTSKTHQIFRESLIRVSNNDVVQELIITSPLGAVPRELELYYPAAQYDIPVTGHWGLEEQRMVQELVSSVASKGFEKVVCHLGHGSDFVKEAVDCIDTSQGSPTSRESLYRLEETLSNLAQGYERPARGVERATSLASAARFQFGEGGDAITEGCTVSGNYPYSKIFFGREQMGMLTPERGMISLTLEGASRLLSKRIHWVEMEDFELSGNLFAVGVKDADERIRMGDEAIISRKGELVAVGIAAMNAREMNDLKRGEAVKVRHKKKTIQNQH